MRGNIAQMMQKAQRMQENMQKVQEELGQLEVTGQAGGGVVYDSTADGEWEEALWKAAYVQGLVRRA